MCITYRHNGREVCLHVEEGGVCLHAEDGGGVPCSSRRSVGCVYKQVEGIEGIPRQHFYLTFNGRCLDRDVVLDSPCAVNLHLRLPGGKGGFGSMLRAIGARIEKTTNREACRDLSGRRMRDVNYEKEMGEWLKQKDKETEDQEEREKNKLQKLDRIINPKHKYEDTGYTANLQTNAEKIDDALKVAMQKRDKKLKRKLKNEEESKEQLGGGKQKKKACGWMGVEEEDDTDDDELEDGEVYSDFEGEPIVSAVSVDEPGCSKSGSSMDDDGDGEVDRGCSSSCITGDVVAGSSSCSAEVKASSSCTSDVVAGSSSCSAEVQASSSSTADDVAGSSSCSSEVKASSSSTADDVAGSSSCSSEVQGSSEPGCSEPFDESPSSLNNKPVNTADDIPSNQPETTTNDITINGGSSPDDTTPSSETTPQDTPAKPLEAVNLDGFTSAQQLEDVGLDVLKFSLTELGLKCGGTLQERAHRLFSTKNVPRDQLDPSLFAKPSKGKKKKQKK